jgi:carbon-monoxide dehydrogenase large subunit
MINPLTLNGQLVGAVVQGLGGAFMEQLSNDEQGQLLTGSLSDYLIPTATDFPKIRGLVMESHPSPINPLGAKGAGEGGIIPVGGVMARGRRRPEFCHTHEGESGRSRGSTPNGAGCVGQSNRP